MQSPKMTTLLTFMFIVIASTSSFVAAAPTYAEAVDENVENVERGLKAEDERQFADVAEQEIEPAEQQGTVAQPHCFKICVKRGRFGVCVRWDRRCRRTLSDAEAESANVQGSEANLQQENVAEREVGPVQQDAAVARHVTFGCRMECKRKVWKGCIDWTRKCRRSLDNQQDATAVVSGSGADQQSDVAEPEVVPVAQEENVNADPEVGEQSVAEQEVQPVIQQEAAARTHCITICVKWRRFGGCARWGSSCRRSLNDDEAGSANIYGSEVDQQADVAEPEVEPVVQEEAVAQSHCTKICIVRDRNSGRCFRYYLKCPKRQ